MDRFFSDNLWDSNDICLASCSIMKISQQWLFDTIEITQMFVAINIHMKYLWTLYAGFYSWKWSACPGLTLLMLSYDINMDN